MSSFSRLPDMMSKFEALEKRLSILERTSRLQNASIGSGGLVVRDGGSVTIESPGDLYLMDQNGLVIWRASTDAIQLDGGYETQSGLTVPDSWNTMGTSGVGVVIQVPGGFDRVQFMGMVGVGQSFSGGTEGNVSVQPSVTYRGGTYDGNTYHGPVINSGNSTVSVAQSFWSQTWLTGSATRLEFGLRAARGGTGSAVLANSGNWHATVSTTFKRK